MDGRTLSAPVRTDEAPTGAYITWFLIDAVSSKLMEQTRGAQVAGEKGPRIFVLEPNLRGSEFYANVDNSLAAGGYNRTNVLRWITEGGMDGYTQQDILPLEKDRQDIPPTR